MSNAGKVNHALLGLRRIEGAHTGENQCALVWKVIQEYSLQQRIGFFTLDNATNNDVTLRALAVRLQEEGTKSLSNVYFYSNII